MEGADVNAMKIIDNFVVRERRWARDLVLRHDRHEPDAITEVRRVYADCCVKSSTDRSIQSSMRRSMAIEKLRRLDEAGLTCVHCAPGSACEFEEVG